MPPTKVAKTSTSGEETIIQAISSTTIHATSHTTTPYQHQHHNYNNTDRRIPSSPIHCALTSMIVENSNRSPDPLLQSSVHSGVVSHSSDEDGDDVPMDQTHPSLTTSDKYTQEQQQQKQQQTWERDCRAIELYHRQEWYDNAVSQTSTTTIYSSITRTEKEQYRHSILHPQHCLTFLTRTDDDDQHCDTDAHAIDTASDRPRSSSIPWWMSTDTGCVAILDQIPTPPIGIPTPPLPGVCHNNGLMILLLPSPCHRIGSLLPGTIVVATELITLSSSSSRSYSTNPEIPVFTPIAISPIRSDEDNYDPYDMYPPGRLGWIQLLKISSPQSGYCVLSIDGYALAGPGLPHHYIPGGRHCPIPQTIMDHSDTTTSSNVHYDDTELLHIDNKQQQQQEAAQNTKHAVLDGWYWRVMCIEGAYVRNGIDLTAHHVATIPYGSFVRVLRKSINAMGLSRLQIDAIYYNNSNNTATTNTTSSTTSRHNETDDHPQYVTGWISEFLNPLSGQRGPIVLPLPFPVPALYQVSLSEGAVIRSDVELSSPMIGHAPLGTVLSVIGCTYTEQPKDQCVARYRLAGNGGYINVKLNVPSPHDDPVVQYIGIDNDFNPNEPHIFHRRSVENNMINSHRTLLLEPSPSSSMEIAAPHIYTDSSQFMMVGQNNRTTQQQRRVLESFRQDDDHNDDHNSDDENESEDYDESQEESSLEIQSRPSSGTHLADPSRRSQHDPTRHRSMTKVSMKRAGRMSSSSSQHPSRHYCVICLCDERTATIIHGETGHIVCCLLCARILKARGDPCPVCRLPIDSVIQHFWA